MRKLDVSVNEYLNPDYSSSEEYDDSEDTSK